MSFIIPIVALLVFISILYVVIQSPSTESEPFIQTIVEFKNPYMCGKFDDEYLPVEQFTPDDDIYVCGKIWTNEPKINGRLWIIIDKDKKTLYTNYVYDNFDVPFTAKTKTIPLGSYFEPGHYFVDIHYYRTFSTSITFDVIPNPK
jgi:hypothetical protein